MQVLAMNSRGAPPRRRAALAYRSNAVHPQRIRDLVLIVSLAVGLIAVQTVHGADASAADGWSEYGHDAGGTRFSGARQIDRSNVAQLQLVWTARTGALGQHTNLVRKAAFESTAVLIDGRLYLTTPYDHVLALDPQNGSKLWEFDPGVNLDVDYSEVTSRGVAAWLDPRAQAGAFCRRRLFVGTLDARLIALDGLTGKPCEEFGRHGA